LAAEFIRKPFIIQGFQNFRLKRVTMPIYAYRCEACGYARDVLQKISDAPLTECESCGKPEFKKQLTAAGFQLKGSGWYVTDFRNGPGDGKAKSEKSEGGATTNAETTTTSSGAKTDSAPASTSTTTTTTTSPDSKPSKPTAT
jgi:putative FmdB family regulatory protein